MLLAHTRLRDAGEALIAAANEAGGRDNITVVLVRLEDVQVGQAPPEASALPEGADDGRSRPRETASAAQAVAVPVRPRQPRLPLAGEKRPTRRSKVLRRAGALAAVLVVVGLIAAGAYVALQSVYFIGTNSRGLITVYRGVPYRLPGNLALYSSDYVSGVSASTLTPERRHALLDHSLRSEGSAAALVRSLELGLLE
jgi:protein phosphatase